MRFTPRYNPTSTATGCATSAGSTTTGSKASERCAARWCARRRGTSSHDVGRGARGAGRARGGRGAASGFTFLVSAHASNEEIFLVERLGQRDRASAGPCSEKPQPAGTKFKVPPVDAPNVNGARDLGLPVGDGDSGRPTCRRCAPAVEAGQVPALYVVDPGPEGSIGDVSWVVAARQSGKLSLLVYQGVLLDGTGAGRRHRAARRGVGREGRDLHQRPGARAGRGEVFAAPGEALDDREIFFRVGQAPRVAAAIRAPPTCARRIADVLEGQPGVRRAWRDRFARPVTREALAAGVEPVGALEVGLHVPGPAAGRSSSGRQLSAALPQLKHLSR